jgi:hypothetical protein
MTAHAALIPGSLNCKKNQNEKQPMPVPIEFMSIVVNRAALDRQFSGGSAAFIAQHEPFDKKVNAYDQFLVKFGAPDSGQIYAITQDLESLGLKGMTQVEDENIWSDYCVIDEADGVTLRCDWISYDFKTRLATYVAGD